MSTSSPYLGFGSTLRVCPTRQAARLPDGQATLGSARIPEDAVTRFVTDSPGVAAGDSGRFRPSSGRIASHDVAETPDTARRPRAAQSRNPLLSE